MADFARFVGKLAMLVSSGDSKRGSKVDGAHVMVKAYHPDKEAFEVNTVGRDSGRLFVPVEQLALYKPGDIIDPRRFLGRSALLSASNKHVKIESFQSKNRTFTIKTVDNEMIRGVHLRQLQLYSLREFTDVFPDAPVVAGEYSMALLPAGSVVDFSSTFPVGENAFIPPWNIYEGSCRVIGDSLHSTILKNVIRIDASGIFEFEHIRFEPPVGSPKITIDCQHGHVAFRNCSFGPGIVGVLICHAVDENNSAIFENCTFTNLATCGVDLNGHATFVNCTFNNVGLGIALNSSLCSARVFYSSFSRCIGGIVVPHKGDVDLRHCIFSHMTDFAVLASNGSILNMSSCTVSGCVGDGVVVEGRGATESTFTGCTIEKCRSGVRVGNGRVNVVLNNVTVQECRVGLYAAVDTVGPVALSNCTLSANNMQSINISGDRCTFSIDGQTEQPDTQVVRLFSTAEFMAAAGIKYGYPSNSAAAKRILSSAGMYTTTCTGCKLAYDHGAQFKKCNQCREARYCSRGCYVEHMSDGHSEVCSSSKLRSKMLSLRGYVACEKCGKLECENQGGLHRACNRCTRVFYCSRECQVDGWTLHKKECRRRQKRKVVY